jgi:hypothetical protein
MTARYAPAKYNIPSRQLYNALLDLDGINAERLSANQATLIESSERGQVFPWASKFTGAPIQEGHGYTQWELRESFIQSVTTELSKKVAPPRVWYTSSWLPSTSKRRSWLY